MNQVVRIGRNELRDPSLFSAGEFGQMISLGAFRDMRAELVEGRIERMAPANGDHGQSNADVVMRLGRGYEGANVAIATDLAVRIDEFTVRGIDIAVASGGFRGKEPTPAADLLLAVEVSDTTLGRDLGPKAAEYAASGIPNYWVIDLNSRVVHVMAMPTDVGYSSIDVVRFGERLILPSSDRAITIA